MDAESHYINLGRKLYNEHPSEDFEKQIFAAEPVAAFLIKKGFYFEMGRQERLAGLSYYELTLDETKGLPKSWPEQTGKSLLTEIQIMYDAGWDNPNKHGEIK